MGHGGKGKRRGAQAGKSIPTREEVTEQHLSPLRGSQRVQRDSKTLHVESTGSVEVLTPGLSTDDPYVLVPIDRDVYGRTVFIRKLDPECCTKCKKPLTHREHCR